MTNNPTWKETICAQHGLSHRYVEVPTMNPTTGNTTPAQAQELLFSIARKGSVLNYKTEQVRE